SSEIYSAWIARNLGEEFSFVRRRVSDSNTGSGCRQRSPPGSPEKRCYSHGLDYWFAALVVGTGRHRVRREGAALARDRRERAVSGNGCPGSHPRPESA